MNAKATYKTILLGEWLNLWFTTYKVPNLQPTSIRNIEQMIRLHTPQWLKNIPLAKVSIFDIDKALAETPRGRTRVYARQVLGSAFLKAYRLGMIDKNVMELTEPIKYKKVTGKCLTIQEQRNFLSAIEGKRMENLFRFYLFTGVRRCEALTLEWSDIDESESLILIKGTKTKESYRHILLTKEVKEILIAQKAQNESERKKGKISPDEKRVFPYCMENVSRTFKKLCPAHHLHDLRHTFITRCAECGVNVTVCQQLVGHSTADMTLNVYTHVMDEFKRKEALKFTIYPHFGQN